MIYLDNGATSFPKPECVLNSFMWAQRTVGANPGRGSHRSTVKSGEIIYRAREETGKMFSCDSERVIFTNNCTVALNTAIKGIAEDGDHFIISSLEHNSVLRPLEYMRRKGKIDYDVAVVVTDDDCRTVQNFSSLIRNNTKAIICTYCSNVFGTVLPVKKIGDLCRNRNIRFIVDGAQAAGSYEINMKENNISVLCVPGHKGLLGPMGTGAMLLSGDILPEPLLFGGTGSFSMQAHQPSALPDMYESGTLNFPGIAGLLSGIRFVTNFGGVRAVHSKESDLIKVLAEDLSVMRNVRVCNGMHSHIPGTILSFNVRGRHSEEIGDLLDRNGFAVRAGYHCAYLAHKYHGEADVGCVRVSPGIFNSKKDIKNLIFSLNKIVMS